MRPVKETKEEVREVKMKTDEKKKVFHTTGMKRQNGKWRALLCKKPILYNE